MELKDLAELHRHLDGSMRRATLQQLAERLGLEVPETLCFRAGMGLAEALSRFQFTLSCLQTLDAVHRVASEMCEDAKDEGIGHLEIRFAPQLHSAPIQDVVEAALAGISGQAGLILCGLYGESPMILNELVQVGAQYPGVVGIDLAGGPLAQHDFGLKDYAAAFQRAGEFGLGRTVHAGEGRPPQEIAEAIRLLGADRIGHGTTLLDDPDVLDLVVSKGIVIEACPTSNVHTGVIQRVEDHPVSIWLDKGVRVSICTDNTLLSDVTLPEEMKRTQAIPGMNDEKVSALVVTGRAAVFT